MQNYFFERQYCMDCMTIHNVEIVRQAGGATIEICHGETWDPSRLPTHYIRHIGHGRYEAVAKCTRANIAIDAASRRQDDNVPQWYKE